MIAASIGLFIDCIIFLRDSFKSKLLTLNNFTIMRRILLFVAVCIMAVAFITGCKKKVSNTPSQAAKESAELIKSGNYDEFVEHLYFEPAEASADSVAVATPAHEVAKNKEHARQAMKTTAHKHIQEQGGIKNVVVKSETVAPDGKTADVVMTVQYNNDLSEDVSSAMILDQNVWKVRVTPHKEVWRIRTSDGQHMVFKLISGENREVLKDNENDDKDVLKEIERGNTEISKVKHDGEKDVVKVKDKDNEVVVKTKHDGEREVERIQK